MKAFDKDVASSDILGEALSISYTKLVEDEEEKFHDLDIFLDCKKTGNIKFTTKFIFCKPDPPPNPLLNSNCRLNLIIKKATFLKDADMFGKQDPYIQFMYNGKQVKTDVKDDAGLNAEWNEKFCLTDIESQIQSGKRLVFEAYDKDIGSSDLLGQSKRLSFVSLIEEEEE